MYPNREEALDLLKEAEKLNPGPWGNHSRTVAHCAERIAALSSMNPDRHMYLDYYMTLAGGLERDI